MVGVVLQLEPFEESYNTNPCGRRATRKAAPKADRTMRGFTHTHVIAQTDLSIGAVAVLVVRLRAGYRNQPPSRHVTAQMCCNANWLYLPSQCF